MDAGALLDAFALLGIETDATEAQIRTAYRKRSLQWHPDKVRDLPQDVAADRFHKLSLAYEQLMNPGTRADLAQKMEQERERRARHDAFDSRRKQMAADLEEREAYERQIKAQRERARREHAQRVSALREEGHAMRVDKHEKLLKEWQARQAPSSSLPQKRKADDELPPLGPMDTTALLRFPVEQLDEMGGDALFENAQTTPLAAALVTSYGPLATLAVKPPKKRREVSALATFTDIQAASRAVEQGSALRCTHPLLEETWIGWGDANFKARASVPERVAYWQAHPTAPRDAPSDAVPAPAPEATPKAGLLDAEYEAQTLQRLQRAAVSGAA